MSIPYILSIRDLIEPQSNSDDSFIGGIPKLPVDVAVPSCDLCGAEQSFFFQVAFPQTHIWEGISLAVFSCTSCVDENYLIPRMLDGPLYEADIPAGFLNTYQVNFRFLTFKTKSSFLSKLYTEKVKFRRLDLTPEEDPGLAKNKIGGHPNWILEDESPATYKTTIPMGFLMQILQGFKFDTVEGAPPKMELSLLGEPEPSPFHNYELFIGNAVYLFGTYDVSDPLVYAITQVN